MDKLKIESITSIKELSFDINQFDIPKVFFVDFTDVRFKYEYEKLNGENRRTDKINEIIVKAINSEVYDKAVSIGLDYKAFNTMEIHIVGNIAKVKELHDKAMEVKIKLNNPRVLPKWVSQGNSGGWNGVKLVAEDVLIDD